MAKLNKKFSKAEKLAVLKEAQNSGVQVTLRKHGIYPGTYYSWKKKFEELGEIGLDRQARTRKDSQAFKKLSDENALLKQLLAEKEMECAMQNEILKKKYPWACRNGKT